MLPGLSALPVPVPVFPDTKWAQAAFEIRREVAAVTLTAAYAGDCDCRVRGRFEGTVDYSRGFQLRAANGEGVLLTAMPLPAVNQIEVNISMAMRTCTYLWGVNNGAILGLPVEEPLEYTTDGAISVIGFDEELSAGSRRRAGTVGCPEDSGDCRCERAGMRTI